MDEGRHATDEEIFLRSVAEPDLYDQLVDKYFHPLTRFCARNVGNQSDGEHLAIQTLDVALRKREKYTPNGKFQQWLFVIAKRLCIDFLRKRRTNETVDSDRINEHPSLDPLPFEQVSEREIMGLLLECCEQLDSDKRHVVDRHWSHEETFEHISSNLGHSTTKTYNLWRAALDDLKKCMKQKGVDFGND